jgi:hypothetical protein
VVFAIEEAGRKEGRKAGYDGENDLLSAWLAVLAWLPLPAAGPGRRLSRRGRKRWNFVL